MPQLVIVKSGGNNEETKQGIVVKDMVTMDASPQPQRVVVLRKSAARQAVVKQNAVVAGGPAVVKQNAVVAGAQSMVLDAVTD